MKTRKTIIHTGLLSVLALSGNAYSGSVTDSLNDLHKRLHKMETSQQAAASNVQIHGAVEVEYGYSEDYAKVDSSDIVLATVELGLETSVNDNVDIQVSLLHEEDDTPLEVDVGIISLYDEGSPLTVSLGQMYVPFGAFESNMVSDPLTLEIGESRESAILLNYEASGLSAGMFVFNGDIEEVADEDKVMRFGLSLCFEGCNFSGWVDYLSGISDSVAIQDHLGAPAAIVNQVAGLSVHAAFSMDAFSVIFEYVGSLDDFDVSEIAFNGQGAEPSAMNIEFAKSLSVAGRDGTIAFAYQTTDEALDLGLPETRVMIAYSTEIYESTSLGIEYLRDSDYSVTDGGTDETSDTFTLQLATGF